MSISITGDGIKMWQLLSLIKGIELYLKTGMQATRQYTPKNMRASASIWTGQEYPRSKMALRVALGDLQELYNSAMK